ncbi:HAL/PAL/TAL family ammonia-lyase [Haloarcula halophila]|uniref:HAL/PAL/TAL family ammonia-lyase n=1 Tax=Haloarcula TaxID=2237 RepID=UPI0023E3608F|nr:aromatic amino acid ammonia-lyase [Halomicroarcula sp. DFY41]
MIPIDGSLTVDEVRAVADGEPMELTDDARERMDQSRAAVDDIIDGDDISVYGVNTGFGDLKDISVGREEMEQHQQNLLRSHQTATGPPVSPRLTRAILAVRANALAVGVSGVRPELVDRLCTLLNMDVLPLIPSEGSADNACELANVGLVLAGEGEALVDGERCSGSEPLDAAGLDPFRFGPKESIALISGTAVTTARTAVAIADLRALVTAADIAGAWTFELVGTEPGAFDERIFDARPVAGHATTAAHVRVLTSATPSSADMTQDPLSIRCLPQVNGALREHLGMSTDTVETELASATDNPLIFPDKTARSCGTFNAQYVAGVADLLALTTRKVGAGSEARSSLLLAADEHSPHLADEPGLESGLARAQYAAASLVTEAGTLDTASDRSFIASSGQEDIHSAGNVASANLLATVDKIARVVAVELICCARATRQTGTTLPPGLAAAREFVEDAADVRSGDVPWSADISSLGDAVRDRSLVDAVRQSGVDIE